MFRCGFTCNFNGTHKAAPPSMTEKKLVLFGVSWGALTTGVMLGVRAIKRTLLALYLRHSTGPQHN
jgi:hypothetical protein